ncbi:reverse transcriptase domain-containing protein [Solibacillus isronensis]|uniref:reverse transcriptase domain-containing protein n=1 Tax=Solibacillus isronensis TaxID=412383 RepID=UPI00203E460D|nr:reverse transcriptase domain-containing protein [Solibacillus isronensis]MCM3722951.1 reverse transcriptase domain-containing protein [Solibacillus isronensis]
MLNPEKYKTKRYLHFDKRVKIENVESYVTNSNKIGKHSFLPFIHYVSSFNKNIGTKNPEMKYRPIKRKDRNIMYSGHLDNYIYKYYADEILNTKYNNWCLHFGIDECVTAYRNKKDGKSNIDFAAEIISNIVNLKEAYILVGDFTSFFDKIDHKLLKKNLIRVLEAEKLSNDWFNVYKSITKYGYYEKNFLTEKFGTDKQIKSTGKRSYFNELKDFRTFQRENPANKNENKYGIPQGTAISAVFANLYSIEFDLEMKQLADRYSGLYRRYSDDFILVIPMKKEQLNSFDCLKKIEVEVRNLASKNKIEVQEEKTGLFIYSDSKIKNLNDPKTGHIDYLGFVFDGNSVKMRGKSPYKFYRKAYQMIDSAKKVKDKKSLEKLPYRKKIYSLYTDLGINRGEFGNFITYAKRAQEKFDEISPHTKNIMILQIKNRKKKIERRLGINIHTKVQ